MFDRAHFERLDAEDPLASLTRRFRLPEGVTYLDGNSLGPLPDHVPQAVAAVVEEEWGTGLIRSWNDRGWWTMAREVGDMLAPLLGVPPGTVVAGDTTTVALFKAAVAAGRLRPERRLILTDTGNFPTDSHALDSASELIGAAVVRVAPDEVVGRIDEEIAVVALTHVDYRTARRHDLEAVTAAAHRAGALVLWDLSHSVGAMDLDLSTADMAVGCGYKYLNGGPGAPAFTYVNRRHIGEFHNPIAGWWGHAHPFAMQTDFEPASDIARVQIGTQPIISLAALRSALEVFDGVPARHLRLKSEVLVDSFIRLVDDHLPGFELVTPREADRRGSHVALAHSRAPAIMAALISGGVIGDVRPPRLLRFGLAPAFQRYVDVWDAVEAIHRVVEEEAWRVAPSRSGPVT